MLIQNSDRNHLSNQELAWLAGTLLCTFPYTVEKHFVNFSTVPLASTTMHWWALAMTAHPEVQRRAQAELDTVVTRRSRTPTFSDALGLPFIQTMISFDGALSLRLLSHTPRRKTTGTTDVHPQGNAVPYESLALSPRP